MVGIEKLGGIIGEEDTLLALDTANVDPADSEQLGDGGLRTVNASPCRDECTGGELDGMTVVEESSVIQA